MSEQRVWIRERRLKNGKTSRHLRWVCPSTHRWKSRLVEGGSDLKRAQRAAALLEKELNEGRYRPEYETDWTTFVDAYCSRLPGEAHRREAERTLTEFGEVVKPGTVRRVRLADVERFFAYCVSDTDDHRANRPATLQKKRRYLTMAFLWAIRRGYAGADPTEGLTLERPNEKDIRVVSDAEEKALLTAAEALYGLQWRAMIYVAIRTAARRSELLRLTWDRIDFDNGFVLLVKTKGKRDRRVPLADDTVAILRKVQAQTLRDAGPFATLEVNFKHAWERIKTTADCADLKFHDLKSTAVTRWLAAGVPLTVVSKLAAHTSIATTVKHYARVDYDDFKAAVRAVAAG